MPAQTATIAATGGDYSTMSAWESGEQQNLLSAAYIHTATFNDFEDDSAGVTLAGWGTNSSYYIVMQGASKPSLPWSATSSYTFRPSSASSGFGLRIQQRYTRIYDIQVHCDSAWASNGVSLNEVYLTIDRMYLYMEDGGASTYAFTSGATSGLLNKVSNLIVWVLGSGITTIYGIGHSAGTPFTEFYNCLFFTDSPKAACFGFYESTGTLRAYNCISFNCSTAGRDFFSVNTDAYCATSQASGDTGLSGTGAVHGITDKWTSSSTGDFRFTSFPEIDDEGGNYDTITTVDILGTARASSPGAWSIGPFSPIPSQTATGVIAAADAEVIAPAGLETPVTVTGALAAAEATAIQNASLSGAQYVTAILAGAEAHVLDDVIVSLGPWTTQRTSDDSWADQTEQSDGWTDATPQTDSWVEQ